MIQFMQARFVGGAVRARHSIAQRRGASKWNDIAETRSPSPPLPPPFRGPSRGFLSGYVVWTDRPFCRKKKEKKKKKKKKKKKRESDSRHLIKGDKGRRDD
jgi:hypothetical protein